MSANRNQGNGWHPCRLTVRDDNGRLHWCIGKEQKWTKNLKKLTLIPVFLLIVVLISVLVSHFTKNSPKVGKENAAVTNEEVQDGGYKMTNPKYLGETAGFVENFENREVLSEDERDVYREIQTAFVLENKENLTENAKENSKERNLLVSGTEDDVTLSKRRVVRQEPENLTWTASPHRKRKNPKLQAPENQSKNFWKLKHTPEEIRTTQSENMRKYIDDKTDPCDDFYQYACGNWHLYNPIPPDRSSFDTFEMLRENLDSVLRDLLEENSSQHENHRGNLEEDESDEPEANKNLSEENLAKYQRSNFAENNDQQEEKDRNKGFLPLRQNIGDKELIVGSSDEEDEEINADYNNDERFGFEGAGLNLGRWASQNSLASFVGSSERGFEENFGENLFGSEDQEAFKNLGGSLNAEEDAINKGEAAIATRSAFGGEKPSQDFNEETLIGEEEIGFFRDEQRSGKTKTQKYVKANVKLEKTNPSALLKAKLLYKSCMDVDEIKLRGIHPLLSLLKTLGGWPILNGSWDDSKFDFERLLGELRLYNNDIIISEWVGPDIRNSEEYVIQIDQSSLGLPSRDYFIEKQNSKFVDAYKTFIKTTAVLLGGDFETVEVDVEDLVNFEIELSAITVSAEHRKNVSDIYVRLKLRELCKIIPQIDWIKYIHIVLKRKPNLDLPIVTFSLNYLHRLVGLLSSTRKRTVANYLLWRFIRHRINNLDDRFQDAKQRFYRILFGRERAPSRWQSCVSQVNSNLGMALGNLFVTKYFDENSKNDTLEMTRQLRQSFKELLMETNWLDFDTKISAALKINYMRLKIGYPNYILSEHLLNKRYKDVRIDPKRYFENTLSILRHLTSLEHAKLSLAVDKNYWNSPPAVVNAYYSRNKNQIMFPAGILQPPFYHRNFPKCLNYGGIGVVIGHEMTHGFDDKGRLFDKDGNLKIWWKKESIDEFHQRSKCLISQYNSYFVPEAQMQMDGANTQGENIADNGGIKQAFRAYKSLFLGGHEQGETLPGMNLTGLQLFFLNFAQIWCGSTRPEAARNKLRTAVHSPGRFRVIGTLSNSDEFAEVFACPVGARMNPREKCKIW